MAIYEAKREWSPEQLGYVRHFLLHCEADVKDLPECCVGSIATVAETDNEYIYTLNGWKLQSECEEIIPGSGGGGVDVVAREQIAALSEEIEEIKESATEGTEIKLVEMTNWIEDWYYDASGDTIDLDGGSSIVTSGNYKHQRIDYKKGDVYHVTGVGGAKPRLWVFVADDGTIISKDGNNGAVVDKILSCDVDCTLLVQLNKNKPGSLYKETRVSVLENITSMSARLSAIENTSYVFGAGINCDYATPTIPALDAPNDTSRLSYFYGLYDALVKAYPDYVQKIDCDAEMTAAGITRPDALSEYPTYMYKFAPAFTPVSSGSTNTLAKPITLFVTTGTHGEKMAVWDMYQTMKLICESWQTDENLEALRWEAVIYVMPCSVPYVVANNTRVNHNGVDVNRNCPTSAWVEANIGEDHYTGPSAASEYETKLFLHYFDTIRPHVYIDHHNSSRTSTNTSWWGTAGEQQMANIVTTVISDRSRKLRKRLEGVYPAGNWNIDGHVHGLEYVGQGVRSRYAYEQGVHACTFESNSAMFYENGENITNGTGVNGSAASTVATDGMINLLLLALKELAKRPYIPAD